MGTLREKHCSNDSGLALGLTLNSSGLESSFSRNENHFLKIPKSSSGPELYLGESNKSLRYSVTSSGFSNSTPTSPISLTFNYPFKNVNNMTIIENKTYDVMDE